MIGTATVVIAFHSRLEELSWCLGSIESQGLDDVRVVVVDVSSDGAAASICRRFDHEYIWAPANRGYGWALNQGARVAHSRVVIFANSDIHFEDGSIGALIQEAANGALCAPIQLDVRDMSDEWPALSRNSVLPAGRSAAFAKWWGIGRMGRSRRRMLALAAEDGRVEVGPSMFAGSIALPQGLALSGACLAMESDCFSQLGGWDEDFFMYFEDVDICLRARDQGAELRLVLDSRIRHIGGWKYRARGLSMSSPSCVSERLLWRKHRMGPQLLIRILQGTGIAARRAVSWVS